MHFVNPLTDLLHRVCMRIMTSRSSEKLFSSCASVGLRALCKPSCTRRPLDNFRQLRHLAVCDLYATGRLQRRELPAQRQSRLEQQSAMAGRSTAPPTENFASLQQLALQAAKTGAEVRCNLSCWHRSQPKFVWSRRLRYGYGTNHRAGGARGVGQTS